MTRISVQHNKQRITVTNTANPKSQISRRVCFRARASWSKKSMGYRRL